MKCLVALLCVVAAASAVSFLDLVKEEWTAFKMEHKKNYDSEVEDRFRMKIYAENKHKIAKHNQRFQKGLVPFTMKQNKYGDMLHHEFVHTLNGFNRTAKHNKGLHSIKGASVRASTFIAPAHVTLPDQVDWRKKGAVTEIKDQGKCGSCWSFSTTGALEAQHFRKTGYLVSLSEQNLIDCSTSYGNNGCNGGLMDNAFKYIKDNGGIDMERTYPYEGIDDKCRYNPKNSGADDTGFTDVPQGDEEKLMAAVATVGPVSVAIDASQESFQFYSTGVYYDENCSSSQLDHGVSAKSLTKEETKILLGFIENSKIINNKTTNATTNKLKNEEWKCIADQFNAVVGSSYRTPQQLRLKWENLKKNSRKRNTQIRMNNIKTGGGAPEYIPPDDVLDRVAALLGSTVDGFVVAYGGDAEQVPENAVVNSVGGGEIDSDSGFVGVTNIVTGNEVLREFVVSDAGPCSLTPPKPKSFISTPRASGFKRKIKTDENRAARNQSISDYYLMKTKILEANLENILLENKKLKLELENLQNKD